MSKKVLLVVAILLASTLVNLALTPPIKSAAEESYKHVKVLWDDYHGQYFDYRRCPQFKQWLEETFDLTINYYSTGQQLTYDFLSQFHILIFTDYDPFQYGRNLTVAEQEAIKSFVEHGGRLFILATHGWEQKYFTTLEASAYNNITAEWGLEWTVSSIYDPTDNIGKTYRPILKGINSEHPITQGVTQVQYYGGFILPSANWIKLVYGDDDTYGIDHVTGLRVEGSNVVGIAAYEHPSGGRVVASGSSYLISNKTYHDSPSYWEANEVLIKNIMYWLAEGIQPEEEVEPKASISISVPEATFSLGKWVVYANTSKTFTLTVKVKNNGEGNAYNVTVQLNAPENVEIIGSSSYFTDVIPPGGEESYAFMLKCTADGTYTVTITVAGENMDSKTMSIEIVSTSPEAPPTTPEKEEMDYATIVAILIIIIAIIVAIVYIIKLRRG